MNRDELEIIKMVAQASASIIHFKSLRGVQIQGVPVQHEQSKEILTLAMNNLPKAGLHSADPSLVQLFTEASYCDLLRDIDPYVTPAYGDPTSTLSMPMFEGPEDSEPI